MASKHENRNFKLSFMPWRPGLITAGQETSVPEDALRKATNIGTDLDGMIRTRPGLDQWGQTLKKPDASATDSSITALQSFLTETGYVTAGDTTKITAQRRDGMLQMNVAAGTTETRTESYVVSALSSNAEWSFRFMFRGVSVPDIDDATASTAATTFAFRVRGDGTNAKQFAIWEDGLYYQRASDDEYILITGSEFVGTGSWHAIEIRCDSTNTLVYVDDTLIATLTSSLLKTATFQEATAPYEFVWTVEDSTGTDAPYSTYISTPMYNDVATDAFAAVPVVALHDYQYLTSTNTKVRVLVAAAGNYIYHDKGLQGAWRPLARKTYTNVYFAKYRTTLVWSDNNGGSQATVRQWDGRSTPTVLDDAPPVRFLVEHQKRLLAWGDVSNPRRVYYSGDRLPNVWFSPSPTNTEDEFNELIDAGYVEIESRGAEVKAVLGDYYGIALIAGEQGFWKLAGSGVFSYQMAGLKVGTGAVNAHSLVQVGNDAWSVGTQGLVSLAATEQFGDLQASSPSVPIQDLWRPGDTSPQSISQTYIDKSRMVYDVRSSSVYIAVPLVGDQTAQKVFVYNTNTQKFVGPWEVDAQAIAAVEVASPITDVVMVGGTSGKIAYFNPFISKDYRSDDISTEFETSALNGRTLNPQYVMLTKTFKKLRLYLLPRGEWEFTVTWWTDEDTTQSTSTRNQNNFSPRAYVLSDDFKLDLEPDGVLSSGGELALVEIPLDRRGRHIYIKITQSDDMPVQGYDVEGLVTGVEVA